jgi:hypothetical protein
MFGTVWAPGGVGGGPEGFTVATKSAWSSTTTYDSGLGDFYLADTGTTIENFTGYDAMFAFPYLRAIQGASWWFWNDKTVTFDFSFEDAHNLSHRVDVWVQLKGHEQDFGYMIAQSVKACVRLDEQPNDFNDNWGNSSLEGHGETRRIVLSSEDQYDLNGGYVRVLAKKMNDTSLFVSVYNYQANTHALASLFNTTVPVESSLFDEVIPFLTVTHAGHGEFQGTMNSQTFYSGSEVLDVPDSIDVHRQWGFNAFLQQLFADLTNFLPPWLKDFVRGFGLWFDWLWPALNIISSIVISLAPYFPFIMLFYVIDIVYTSVTEGTIQPIGNLAMSVYNLTAAVIGTLVSIAQTAYSIIHFW